MTSPNESARVLKPDLLHRGLREAKSPPLSPFEKLLVAVTCMHLCILPWALGAMHSTTQFVSLGFSVVGISITFFRWDRPDRPYSGTRPGVALRAFPPFWLGLLLLAYIAAQTLNPSWQYLSSKDSWWLEPLDHVSWLPTSIKAPFERSNPWRFFLVFSSLWLLGCSVWAGFRHRRSYRTLFTVLVINGFFLALLGVVQHLTEAKKIFWTYTPSNPSFIASFIYRNHAGSYFNLLIALAVGLGWWHYRRSHRRLDKSSPSGAYTFVAVFVGLMVVFSYSRMSILLLLAFMALIALAMGARLLGWTGAQTDRNEALVLILTVSGFLGVGIAAVSVERVWQRFAGMISDPVASTIDRNLARAAASEMFADKWEFGWGAGCFRHAFPIYAQRYPEIYVSGGNNLKYWEYAHNDLLQFPIELGVMGCIPLVATVAYFFAALIRYRFWRSTLVVPIALSCLLIFVHAWVDFVLQSPAVLFLWAVLLIGATRCVEYDRPATIEPSAAA